jgi:hypothetical protein
MTVVRPRGPLPARVYWTRRLLVIAVAFALVFGVAHLLGGGGGAAKGPSTRPVGAEPSSVTSAPAAVLASPSSSPSPTSPTSPAAGPTDTATTGRGATTTPTTTALAEPAGRCTNSDIVAVPSVRSPAYAGRPVVVDTTLTTKQSPACDWTVSAGSLVVKVTSGTDRIWSTQDCVGAVPRQSVVVRKDHPVSVAVVWDGQRSDAECTRTTPWAETGYYHAVAAAFGSDPVDRQFQLVPPPVRTVTATPTPEHGSGDPTAGASPTRR